MSQPFKLVASIGSRYLSSGSQLALTNPEIKNQYFIGRLGESGSLT